MAWDATSSGTFGTDTGSPAAWVRIRQRGSCQTCVAGSGVRASARLARRIAAEKAGQIKKTAG
jgi:hypothetical protein